MSATLTTGPGSRPARILVADDDRDHRRIMCELLVSCGYDVSEAADGLAALEVIAAADPDIVLLDVRMPGLDGTAVTRAIRDDPIHAGLPIVLVTAHDDTVSRVAGLEAGADDFLTKPVDRLELTVRLRSLMRLNRYRRLRDALTGLAWVFDEASIGLARVSQTGHILEANAVTRGLLKLGTPDEDPRTFTAAASARFSLEPERQWDDWPLSAVDGLPRLLVHQGDGLRPFQVVEVTAKGDFRLPAVLIRLEDVTEAYRARAVAQSLAQAIQHRLRSPLAVLMAELMLGESQGDADGRYRRALKAGDRLADLVDEVTTYADVLTDQGPSGIPVLSLPAVVFGASARVGVEVLAPTVPRRLRRSHLRWSRRQVDTALDAVFRAAQRSYTTALDPIQVGVLPHDRGLELQVVCPLPQVDDQTPFVRGTLPSIGAALSVPALLAWHVGGRLEQTSRRDGWTTLSFVLPLTDST